MAFFRSKTRVRRGTTKEFREYARPPLTCGTFHKGVGVGGVATYSDIQADGQKQTSALL